MHTKLKIEYLSNPNRVYTILHMAITTYSNIQAIAKSTIRKGGSAYTDSQLYLPTDSFVTLLVKDISDAIDISPIGKTPSYGKYKYSYPSKVIMNISEEELAIYISLFLKYMLDAFGKKYVVGLTQEQVLFLSKINIKYSTLSYIDFDYSQTDLFMMKQILGPTIIPLPTEDDQDNSKTEGRQDSPMVDRGQNESIKSSARRKPQSQKNHEGTISRF